jgi:pimeloyl-ACP methyl ester carboxylesterase
MQTGDTLADKISDLMGPASEEAGEALPTRRSRAGQSGKPTSRKARQSLFQRIFGARKAALDALPHAEFSDTPFGIRSFVMAGHGSPAVVFEAGLGHGKRIWGPVFNGVSAITRAVAYDRAGYGQSEPATQPRSGLQIVAELRALLQTQGIAPPYVLVGHSLGGTYMKLFAKSYPDEVVGVVLVDARHSEFTQRCRELGVSRLLYDPPEALLALLGPTPRAELEAAPLAQKQARRGGSFPDVPLIVLTQSNAAAKWPAKLGQVWAAGQRRMAKMSSLGRIKVLDDAGHNVHVDRPDVVVRAVLNVVRAARYLAHQAHKRRA